ncbi:MAG TPA: peptide ABC transporter substrate-binding protein [Bdellovibrionota bacterium]|jgi:ABC-type oligopeptide transport system substrate-binding subunit|nr:peptide ABC transporter substrate-binding protein [Bdellovibrionota bacterium]
MRKMLLFAGALLLAGCSGSPHSRTPQGELVVQLSGDPVTLDPSRAEDGHALRILANTMDGLVGYDESGTLQLLLAESYRFSPDGKRVEFELKRGVKWSDGAPVVAADFITAFRRLADPATASRTAGELLPIMNLRAIQAGKKPVQRLGVRADGDNHLIFSLEHPAPYFVEALSLPMALPLRRDVLKANGGEWPISAPVTGAYRIVERKPDRHILLAPNVLYWNAAAHSGALKIRLIYVQDESTGVSLFENGKLDLLVRVPSLDVPRLRSQGVLSASPFMATYYLGFNLKKAPFDQVEWRRAVAGSIHKTEITDTLGIGDAPAWGWIPRGVEGYVPYRDLSQLFSGDMAKIKKMIAAEPIQAPTVTAAFDSSERNAMVMEKVQRDVEQALGLRLKLEGLDWKSHVAALHTDAPQLYRFGWLAPFGDPSPLLQIFITDNPNNYGHFHDAEYDKVSRQAMELRRGAEREHLIQRAQRILIEEKAVIVPLYHYEQVFAVSAQLQGFRANPSGTVLFRDIRKSAP